MPKRTHLWVNEMKGWLASPIGYEACPILYELLNPMHRDVLGFAACVPLFSSQLAERFAEF